jgi:hypothetical protein
MNLKRIILSISLLALISILLYWQISLQTPDQPSQSIQANGLHSITESPAEYDLDELVINRVGPTSSKLSDDTKTTNPGTRGRLELFGRVTDEDRQPIENVRISEERNIYSTSTGADGKYKITLDIPEYHNPVLQFLRSGYKGKRIKMSRQELIQHPLKQLDVVLTETLDSVTVNGWIGNDFGAGLESVKIEMVPANTQGEDGIYLTVLSGETGIFSLEGIKPGFRYNLSAYATPEYSSYLNTNFVVAQNPRQLIIILDSLKLIDINGMIVNREGTPIPDFEMYMTNISTGTHVQKLVSDSSGFFSLFNYPVGEVSFSTRGPEYYKITGLTLSESTYHTLMLVVDKGNHYLSGWVSDGSGVAVEKASVYLDSTIQNGTIEYSSYRPKSTDQAGRFYFDNVGSGEHKILVLASGFDRQEIIHHFETQTDEIHITLTPVQ